MQVKARYKIFLLIAVVLAIYYPSIWGPYSTVDDIYIVEAYGINGTWSFLDVVKPGRGFYYRPLVDITFYLDKILWDLDPRFMHLENVLLHAANVVLVFLLASRITRIFTQLRCWFPLLAATVFAVHPVNTESVNWIAARTDPLAALFVLASLFLLLLGLERRSTLLLTLAVVLTLFGGLSKEVAFLNLPFMLLLLLWWQKRGEERHDAFTFRFIVALSVTASILFSFLVLHLLLRRGDNSISMILSLRGVTFRSALHDALSALGFYGWKMLFPYPLNFAVNELPPYCFGIGCALLLLIIFTARFWVNRFYSLGIIAAVLFILPPLAVAIAKIAWTPVAERYTYIPAAFFTIAAIGGVTNSPLMARSRLLMAAVLAIVVTLAAGETFSRNLLWQDRLALLEDTTRKSPDFGNIRNELAVELMSRNRLEEAGRQLELGLACANRAEVRQVLELNKIALQLRGKPPEQGRRILLGQIGDIPSARTELLRTLNVLNEARLMGNADQPTRKAIMSEIVVTNEVLYSRLRDPFLLYRSGQFQLALGKREQAAGLFQKAAELAPARSHYKESARKLSEKLAIM